MYYSIVYLILCVLQPICLPVPEVATIAIGNKFLGPIPCILLGVLGSLIGISIMYFLTKKGGEVVVHKFASRKQLNKYQQYVKKNAVLFTGLLFVIPILPDEIVCIGAAMIGIAYRKLLVIATIFKLLSYSMIAFSGELASLLGTNQFCILIAELCMVFVLAYIMKRLENDQQPNVII